MDDIITQAIKNSVSYLHYRTIIKDLLEEGKSTGFLQSEALTKYSELNEVRMNRLDKTIVVNDEVTQVLETLNGTYTWLVITEGWCGDAAQIVPFLHKIAESNSKISLKLVLRDVNETLMDQFLTNGARAIPKLIVFDDSDRKVLATWGPRPAGASQLIKEYKESHGVIDETAKTNLQKWYLQDKGQSIINELVQLMEEVDAKKVTETV